MDSDSSSVPGEAGPERIGELLLLGRGSHILTAAAALGVFDALAEGPRSGDGTAQALGTDPRATRILLDALVGLGLARKVEGGYGNTPTGQRCLVSGGPESVASNLRYQQLLAHAWADLPEVVRDGRPRESLGELLAEDPQFTREYIRGMADISRRPARELAARLDLSNARDALDVGGGPGAYAEALAEHGPELRVVLLDLDPTLRIAEECLADSPFRDRIELRSGNYHEASFGADAFDLILFSHVTHDEGEAENQRMLRNAFDALRPGGRVVVHDFMLEPDRAQPLFGAIFSVHMMTYTQKGRAYCAEEYQQWLVAAGFRASPAMEVCPGAVNATRAMVGTKP